MLPHLKDLIPLTEVGSHLPTKTHRSTVFRWAQKGRRGVKLRVVTIGNTKCTTEAWLMTFFEEVEAARGANTNRKSHSRSQEAGHRNRSATNETLRRHGLAE